MKANALLLAAGAAAALSFAWATPTSTFTAVDENQAASAVGGVCYLPVYGSCGNSGGENCVIVFCWRVDTSQRGNSDRYGPSRRCASGPSETCTFVGWPPGCIDVEPPIET